MHPTPTSVETGSSTPTLEAVPEAARRGLAPNEDPGYGKFVVAIYGNGVFLGYLPNNYDTSLVGARYARRFDSEMDARECGLAWECWTADDDLYATVQQIAPPCDMDGRPEHCRVTIVDGRYYGNYDLSHGEGERQRLAAHDAGERGRA